MAILNSASLKSYIINKQGEKVEVTNKSNTQRTNQVEKDISIVKSSEKDWAIEKEKIKVITTITNNTDIDIENNFQIKDTLTDGANFVDGTLKIGSVDYADLNPITGFTLPITIGGSGGEVVFSYDITIGSPLVINSIKNSTNVTFSVDTQQFTLTSNEKEITILNNEIWILKTASTRIAKTGDEITYTITITNNGELKNTDLVFTDEIPTGTTFVEDSVVIDGVGKTGFNPANGFSLADLEPQGTTTIQFKVIVQ